MDNAKMFGLVKQLGFKSAAPVDNVQTVELAEVEDVLEEAYELGKQSVFTTPLGGCLASFLSLLANVNEQAQWAEAAARDNNDNQLVGSIHNLEERLTAMAAMVRAMKTLHAMRK